MTTGAITKAISCVCCLQMTSDNWCDMKNEDIVLRTWEVESPHNYDNNSSITQVSLHIVCCFVVGT